MKCERDTKSHFYMTHWILQELQTHQLFGVKYKIDYTFVNLICKARRRRRKIDAPNRVNVT